MQFENKRIQETFEDIDLNDMVRFGWQISMLKILHLMYDMKELYKKKEITCYSLQRLKFIKENWYR